MVEEKTIDDFIKNANSILNTLDKDYEVMQSQKSGVKQDQVDKYNGLCDDMNSILMKYSKTIWDFRNKIDKVYDAESDDFIVYEYPSPDKILTMVPILYWMNNNSKLTFKLNVYARLKGCSGYYDSDELIVSETGIEACSSGFNGDKGFSDLVSIFLNHCPTYEQLDTAFQAALTDFIKSCVTSIQKRNENLADKIKSITQ